MEEVGEPSYYNLISYWVLRFLIFNPQLFDIIENSGKTWLYEESYNFILNMFKNYLVKNKAEKYEIKFNKKKILKDAPKLLKRYKQKAWNINFEFLKNLNFIQKLFGLNEVEVKFFTFCIFLDFFPIFRDILSLYRFVNFSKFVEIVSQIIEVKKEELNALFPNNSILFKLGLIMVLDIKDKLTGIIDVPSEFARKFFLPYNDPQAIFDDLFYKAKETSLRLEDFSYIKNLKVLKEYLKKSMERREKGINILLFGPPGTGKTELAKVLAKEVEGILYEIALTDEDGNPIMDRMRLFYYQIAQLILEKKKNVILLFDEADDILEKDFRALDYASNDRRGKNAVNKTWINSILENNKVPAIWIANSISKADLAYLRRFDIVLNISYIPREARLKILKKYFNGLPISEKWIQKVAEIRSLSPALISKAAKVVSIVNSSNSEETAEFIITSFLEALGYKVKIENNCNTFPFLEEVLNINYNPGRLLRYLKKIGKGKLLFFGPPGTGKTEFAKKIASYLDKELLLIKTGEVISAYPAETEKNLIDVFEEAKRIKAILFLDEADPFLVDRRENLSLSELSIINKFLIQMENFEGIFICATNFTEGFDKATIRRFDLKIKFDYLQPEQAIKLFTELFGKKEGEKYQKTLKKLLLTPGDFVIAYKKVKFFNDNISPESFIKALEEEIKINSYSKVKNLGFV